MSIDPEFLYENLFFTSFKVPVSIAVVISGATVALRYFDRMLPLRENLPSPPYIRSDVLEFTGCCRSGHEAISQ